MITKLTSEEFDQLPTKGWGRSSPIYNAIISLKVNEAIKIPKSDWHSKKTPSTKCRKIEKRFAHLKVKYKCITLADGSGWAIKRLA